MSGRAENLVTKYNTGTVPLPLQELSTSALQNGSRVIDCHGLKQQIVLLGRKSETLF